MNNQERVRAWVHRVFDVKTAYDSHERALRMLEEAVELVQACSVSAEEAHKLVDYVYARPVGRQLEEIAGVMVTLYALAVALGGDADAAFEEEIARIQQPEVIARVLRRQAEKREAVK